MMSSPDFPWSHRREDWENPNQTIAMHTNSPAFPWNTADHIAIHYTGMADVPDGDWDELPWDQKVPAFLRSVQNYYVTHIARGYSVGYSCCVTQDGDDWQLRGVDWRTASNSGWNERTFSILCMVDGQDPLTPKALWKVREIIAWFRSVSPFGQDVKIVPHRDIATTGTTCPGEGITPQLRQGLLEPKEGYMASQRLLDTRVSRNPFKAGEVRTFNVGVPNAKAIITLQGQGSHGYLTAWDSGTRPPTSHAFIRPDWDMNTTIVGTGPDGRFHVYASHAGEVIVDFLGVI